MPFISSAPVVFGRTNRRRKKRRHRCGIDIRFHIGGMLLAGERFIFGNPAVNLESVPRGLAHDLIRGIVSRGRAGRRKRE